MKPILKCLGGKRQLLKQLKLRIPENFNYYYEPFFGGGCLGLHLEYPRSILADVNSELINCYQRIRDDLFKVLEECDRHKANDSKKYFLSIRNLDRVPGYSEKCHPSLRAGRYLYINKTAYSGNCRVNNKNQINIPYANYKSPTIYDLNTIKNVSNYLKLPEVKLLNEDFEKATETARKGDFIYFDPPYYKLSKSSSFNNYNGKKFTEDDHRRLKSHIDKLSDRGCYILFSNSWCDFSQQLFTDERYDIIRVMANRTGNSKIDGRGKIPELLGWNKF